MVGRELMEIRTSLAALVEEGARPAAEAGLMALHRLRHAPDRAAHEAAHTAHLLAEGAAPGSPSLHVAAAFQEIHQLVCDHPEFFAT